MGEQILPDSDGQPGGPGARIPLWGNATGTPAAPSRSLLWDDGPAAPGGPVQAASGPGGPPAATAPAARPAAARPAAPPARPAGPPRPPAGTVTSRSTSGTVSQPTLVALVVIIIVGIVAGGLAVNAAHKPAYHPPSTGSGYAYPAPTTDSGSPYGADLNTGATDDPYATASTDDPATDVPSATTDSSSAAPPSSDPDVWTTATGPGGIVVSYPAAWTLGPGKVVTNMEADDPTTDGRFLRFGADKMSATDALTAVRGYVAATPGIQDGYRELQLTAVGVGPAGDGADWEFTFTKEGRTRHAFGRYWAQNGQLYVIYLSTWDDDWSATSHVRQHVFDNSYAP
jgi:hypothetical protein